MRLAAFLLAACVPIAQAQSYCSEPAEPSCISMLGISRDKFTFQLCRDEVEHYRQEVQDYVECLRDDQEDAIAQLNEVIERFNTCARTDVCW